MISAQEQFWSSEFGDQYVLRNQISHLPRIPFWRSVIEQTEAKWICEIGCNIGTNLKALRDVEPDTILHGIDVNEKALLEAQEEGIHAVSLPAARVGEAYPMAFDLTFTAGVLIHIGPDQISEVMDSIIAASRRWVLAVEYAAEWDEEVLYRGHTERLWRRPFGKMYESRGLTVVHEGPAPQPAFDNCYFWLMERA
jgi:pseudaminic acid biosynthesis-associated methylase